MIKDIAPTAEGGIRHVAGVPNSLYDRASYMSCRLQATCGYLDNNNS